VRLLVCDHFFGEDIEALRTVAGPDVEFRVLDFHLVRDEALRVFPPDVATGHEAYARAENEPYRRRWAAILREILEDEFSAWPYDAFISPSDEFFYLRAAAEALHPLGVPFLVVHKETTRSRNTIEVHAEIVKRYAPPIADFMTMCSDRHRTYSLRTGVPDGLIAVTGQPRFDYYAHPERWPERFPLGESGPAVLFLSYMSGLYHVEGEEPEWAEMHRETEAGLWELARRGWRVVIKPHPQQDFRRDRDRIRHEVADLYGRSVFLTRPTDDVRPLLVKADVLVGFQSTALYEAMVAGTPVVYTGWHPDARRLSSEMHAFQDWADVLDPVTELADFVPAVERARGRVQSSEQRARALELAEENLGPVDGLASERTLAVLREQVAEWQERRTPEQEELRTELARRRPPIRLGRRARRDLLRTRRRLGSALGR
jgi:hypothetical protein